MVVATVQFKPPLQDGRGEFYRNGCSTFISKIIPGVRLPRFGVPFSRYSHGTVLSPLRGTACAASLCRDELFVPD
jgi:hypothetical protein